MFSFDMELCCCIFFPIKIQVITTIYIYIKIVSPQQIKHSYKTGQEFVIFTSKNVSEYDQEIPQSQTADKPMAP